MTCQPARDAGVRNDRIYCILVITALCPDARFGAAHTLGLIGDRKAIPGLIRALKDSEPAVRYWAADALGKLRAEEAIGPLAELLHDNHKRIKDHAAEALQQIGSPAALTALRQNSKKKWWPF